MPPRKTKQKKPKKHSDDEEDQVQQEPKQQAPKEQQPQSQEKTQQQAQQQKTIQPLVPKKVSYCPVCTLPFQFCKFGKKAKQCMKLLQSIAPQKVAKYHPNAEQTANEKQEEQEIKPKQKKQKLVKDKYIVIDVKSRAKKKHVTNVTGLKIFNIDSKSLAKKISKKFACSCSNTDQDSIQAQGDFYEEFKEILVEQCGVKSKYILTKEKFNEKFNEQMAKKKEQKRLAQGIQPEPQPIKQQPIRQNLEQQQQEIDVVYEAVIEKKNKIYKEFDEPEPSKKKGKKRGGHKQEEQQQKKDEQIHLDAPKDVKQEDIDFI